MAESGLLYSNCYKRYRLSQTTSCHGCYLPSMKVINHNTGVDLWICSTVDLAQARLAEYSIRLLMACKMLTLADDNRLCSRHAWENDIWYMHSIPQPLFLGCSGPNPTAYRMSLSPGSRVGVNTQGFICRFTH
jgi:hypothetical protein